MNFWKYLPHAFSALVSLDLTSDDGTVVLFQTGVIKLWAPRENRAPWGPILLTLWGPHRDFGAPFELVLLVRREVAFDTAIYPMQNLPSIL